jgi:thioredoxin-related protein
MRSAIISLLFCPLISFTQWQPDFATAQKVALEKHRQILLNFSGSDWCIPCIRMQKEIFDSDNFLQMADTTLVMYNADFPRNKKNELNKKLKKQNEQLADKYNPEGKFPFTLLLDAGGRVIQSWEGYPKETPRQFILQLNQLGHATRN